MNRKTVLVTGGAKGIGEAISKEFARASYNVCINYNSSENEARKLKELLINEGCNVEIFKANVSNRKNVDEMVDFCIKRFDSLDILINNAGICEYKPFCDIQNEEIEKMISINVVGTFNTTQSALNNYMLRKHSGTIINISSIWGIVGASCEVNYSMSKAAIIGMSKALAKELGPSNIRVNVIAPGIIDTSMIKNLTDSDIENIKYEIPLEKIGSVKDVSKRALFLASEDASYITGQVISPNGGWFM